MSTHSVINQHLHRMRVIQETRHFLDDHSFQELICPVLLPSVPAEPTIYPFSTRWDRVVDEKLRSTDLFLPVSPERSMKHYLAAGVGDCYSIGHCFRNLEGAGPTHHPEFLMLEWYRLDHDYHTIMDDTSALLRHLAQKITGSTIISWHGRQINLDHWPVLSVADLWERKFFVSIRKTLDLPELVKLASSRGYATDGATWEQLFNQLFLNEIEPEFPRDPFFLIDFPAVLSPLCRPRADQPWLAERFEVYVDGVELGNGNSEQLDSDRVGELFQAELDVRRARGEFTQPLDTQMLAAINQMQHSGHQFAGIGLGIDRVAMMLGDEDAITDLWPQLDT